jgi:hypothetical protein
MPDCLIDLTETHQSLSNAPPWKSRGLSEKSKGELDPPRCP